MGKETGGQRKLLGGLLGVLVIVGIFGSGVFLVSREINKLMLRVKQLEERVSIMEECVNKECIPKIVHIERARREAESDYLDRKSLTLRNVLSPVSPIKEKYTEFSEDGVPVVDRKYNSFKPDGTGFRVYHAWFKHKRENKIPDDPRVVVKHVTDSPIRAHHRKSAAWSSQDDSN